MSAPKVSIELISRLIDGELSEEQSRQVELLIDQCPLSSQLLKSMKEFTSEFAQAVLEAPAISDNQQAPSDDCLDDNTLIRIVEGTISKAKLKEVETHASGCPHCLKRLLQETRSHTSMSRGNWKDLPPEVAADPRLGGVKYHKPKPKPVIRNVKPEEPHLEDTAFDFVCSGSDKKKNVRLFENESYSLQITSESLRSGLTLEIKVCKGNTPLEHTEVTITENVTSRKIFRGLSSVSGMMMVRRLRNGRYRLHLPVAAIEVNLFIEI